MTPATVTGLLLRSRRRRNPGSTRPDLPPRDGFWMRWTRWVTRRPIAACVGQRVSVAGGAHARRAPYLHQHLDAQMFEKRLEDAV